MEKSISNNTGAFDENGRIIDILGTNVVNEWMGE